MGLGYNTHNMDLEFIQSLGKVFILNNRAQVCYPGDYEGGRFAADDDELWEKVPQWLSKGFRNDALEDSTQFMVRQLTKSGVQGVTKENLFQDAILAKAKAAPNPNSYIFRVLDQMGRKTVDLECTDGQHMALWLSQYKSAPVKLSQGASFIEIQSSSEPSNIWAPVGLSFQDMRSTFIRMMTGASAAPPGTPPGA